MWCGQRRSGRSKGVCLPEALIGIMLLSLVIYPMLPIFRAAADKRSSYVDQRRAEIRASRAEAILKAPVFYCGLGMPKDPTEYKASFGNQKFDPFGWNGPIGVRIGPSGLENSELRIAFSREGSTKLTGPVISEVAEAKVRLHKFPEPNEIGTSFSSHSPDIRNWLFFPSSIPPSLPFSIMGISGKEITVSNNLGTPFRICVGDRPRHMMALSIYASAGILYTKDFRSPGAQPRVNGILDIRFDLDPEHRLITVYILARGNQVHDRPQEIVGKEQWPEKYISYWIEKSSRYRLFATKTVWHLPNYNENGAICDESAAEETDQS